MADEMPLETKLLLALAAERCAPGLNALTAPISDLAHQIHAQYVAPSPAPSAPATTGTTGTTGATGAAALNAIGGGT